MKKHILFIISFYCLILTVQAQFCNSKQGNCYQKDSCFSSAQIHSQDYKYATVHNIYKSATATADLTITVFSPCVLPVKIDSLNSASNCKQCKRPFILLIHGGGFRGGCRMGFNQECMEFAKRGYIAATIDYRLGWVPGDDKKLCNDNFCFTTQCAPRVDDSCKSDYKDSMNFEIYRAMQDISAAMRFIAHYADNLNIDKNYLYIGGHSAGSIAAANFCYMNQQELNLAIPAAMPVLGALNSSGNTFTDTFKITGLYNNWGSLKDTLFINGSKDKIPMIAFHGIDDSVVPFAKGFPIGCINGAYDYTYGSSLIYKRLINKYPGLPVELYCCYGGHGIFNLTPDKDIKSLYRVQKAVCFFNRVRAGDNTQLYVRIDKQEDSISYQQLDSTSSVNCIFAGTLINKDAYESTSLISKQSKLHEYLIYPNPAAANATLFIKDEQRLINISIADVNEKIVWSKNNVTERSISLPVQNFGSGVYFVMIKTASYIRILKLLKSN